MFGRDYEEIGSSSKGLILKNSGKVKIQWGKSLIDLLDNNGRLNVKLQDVIKSVTNESDIKKDGFYFYNGNLFAKVGDTLLQLTSESGNTYVSFLIEQELTSEQKHTALTNIGFVYPTQKDSNIYPTNGIIYIEDSQTLFIVSNGRLSKYKASIPNPFTEQFVIAKDDPVIQGALVIEGQGTANSIMFDNLKIYSKGINAVFETNKEINFQVGKNIGLNVGQLGIQSNHVQSFGASREEGYRIYKEQESDKFILEIDRLYVRDGIEQFEKYYDGEFYSKAAMINYCKCIKKEQTENQVTKTYIDHLIFNLNTNLLLQDGTILNGQQQEGLLTKQKTIVEIPIKVIQCTIKEEQINEETVKYLEPSFIKHLQYTTGVEEEKEKPLEKILRLNFYLEDGNKINPKKLIFVKSSVSNDIISYSKIYPEIGNLGMLKGDNKVGYDYMILDGNCYAFANKTIEDTFINSSFYVVSELKNDPRLKFDFENPQIILEQTNTKDTRLSNYEKISHLEIGNIQSKATYTDNSSEYGLYSNRNVFGETEFREPITRKIRQIRLDDEGNPEKDEDGRYIYDTVNENINYKQFKYYPRYSTNFCKNIPTEIFLKKDEVILPKRRIPRVANFIDDLTTQDKSFNSEFDAYSFDVTYELYENKLLLIKIKYNDTDSDKNMAIKLNDADIRPTVSDDTVVNGGGNIQLAPAVGGQEPVDPGIIEGPTANPGDEEPISIDQRYPTFNVYYKGEQVKNSQFNNNELVLLKIKEITYSNRVISGGKLEVIGRYDAGGGSLTVEHDYGYGSSQYKNVSIVKLVDQDKIKFDLKQNGNELTITPVFNNNCKIISLPKDLTKDETDLDSYFQDGTRKFYLYGSSGKTSDDSKNCVYANLPNPSDYPGEELKIYFAQQFYEKDSDSPKQYHPKVFLECYTVSDDGSTTQYSFTDPMGQKPENIINFICPSTAPIKLENGDSYKDKTVINDSYVVLRSVELGNDSYAWAIFEQRNITRNSQIFDDYDD